MADNDDSLRAEFRELEAKRQRQGGTLPPDEAERWERIRSVIDVEGSERKPGYAVALQVLGVLQVAAGAIVAVWWIASAVGQGSASGIMIGAAVGAFFTALSLGVVMLALADVVRRV